MPGRQKIKKMRFALYPRREEGVELNAVACAKNRATFGTGGVKGSQGFRQGGAVKRHLLSEQEGSMMKIQAQ